MDRWKLLQQMMSGDNTTSNRKTPELTQGVEVPFEQRRYDAPRKIAGPPKPIEAVVPRILTDTIAGAPSTVASLLRMAADYYPEKYTKTNNKVIEASLPEWFLTAITDPNYQKTEAGKKAIEYAKKILPRKEKLQRNLSMREESELREAAKKFITPADKIDSEIPLADEGFKLLKNPKSDIHEQSYHLETPVGQIPNWVNIGKDWDSIPSVGFLNDLPEQLKGNALAAQAYTQLAKQYGTLRSDPSGSSSTAIKKAVWDKFGQPFEHNFGDGFGTADRYELPFSVNAKEIQKPILDRYKNLGEQVSDEASLLRDVLGDRGRRTPSESRLPGASEAIPEEAFGPMSHWSHTQEQLNSEKEILNKIEQLPKDLQNKINNRVLQIGKDMSGSGISRNRLYNIAYDQLVNKK